MLLLFSTASILNLIKYSIWVIGLSKLRSSIIWWYRTPGKIIIHLHWESSLTLASLCLSSLVKITKMLWLSIATQEKVELVHPYHAFWYIHIWPQTSSMQLPTTDGKDSGQGEVYPNQVSKDMYSTLKWPSRNKYKVHLWRSWTTSWSRPYQKTQAQPSSPA